MFIVDVDYKFQSKLYIYIVLCTWHGENSVNYFSLMLRESTNCVLDVALLTRLMNDLNECFVLPN
jgi:hypothetical protein